MYVEENTICWSYIKKLMKDKTFETTIKENSRNLQNVVKNSLENETRLSKCCQKYVDLV